MPQGVATSSILIFFIFAAGMTVAFTVMFILGLFRDVVRMESHWGGLGGGIGGWTMSRPLTSLLAAIAFGFITALLAGGTLSNSPEHLKERYEPVIRMLSGQGGHLVRYYVHNQKVILEATVPDEATKDRIFDEIKLINPAQDDIQANISAVKPPEAAKTK